MTLLEMRSLSGTRFLGGTGLFAIVIFFFATNTAFGYPMLFSRHLLRSSVQRTRPLFTVLNNHTVVPSNQELVQQRLAVALAKKEARQVSRQDVKNRNLLFKRMLDTNSTNLPSLYAVKVSVCEELRESLRLNGRERRGRVFIEVDSDASRSIKGLKQELHSFFRRLLRSTYALQASLPEGTSFIERNASIFKCVLMLQLVS